MKLVQKIMQRSKNGKSSLDGSSDSDVSCNMIPALERSCSEVSYSSDSAAAQSLDDKAKTLKVVRRHFRKMNEHNIASVRKLHTEDCMFYFFDQNGELACEMRMEDFEEIMTSTWASFPDLKFRCLTLAMDENDGAVSISNCVLAGTHTGQPYGFGPFEPVEPSGRTLCMDREDAKIWVRNGKICRHEWHARGEMTGPMGLYTLAGGFPVL